MPELPEVETTVRGLNSTVKRKIIRDLWWDWEGMFRGVKPHILKKNIAGIKIVDAKRRAKNILIELSNGHTLIIHMKMTGHLMFGRWNQIKNAKGKMKKWEPVPKTGPLHDPFNRFIHVMFTLTDGSQLAFCDVRKFGKIEYIKTDKLHQHERVGKLGPEPLSSISPKEFAECILKKPRGKIKTVLMDQTVIAGIGNIYADEILWEVGVHPESIVSKIPQKLLEKMCPIMKKVLEFSIKTGGDSKSDYRNIYGERGGFQNMHRAYRLTGQKCSLRGCRGTIARLIVGMRSAHYCDKHQKIYK